jgi:hypothetical protein
MQLQTLQSLQVISILDKWNLISFHVAQVDNNIQVKVYNGATNTESSSYTFTNLSLTPSYFMIGIKHAADMNLEGLFYEIWWRDDIITDIQTTILAIQGAIPSIFTSPPELDPYKTYLGITCDVSCRNASRSCAGSSTNCIRGWNFGSGKNGFYNLATPIYLPSSARLCSSYDFTTNICSGCSSNLVLSNNSCGCSGDKILQQLYSTYKCMNIIPNCINYIFFEGCSKCDTNYYIFCPSSPCIYSETICVLDCPTGFYKDNSSTATCKACETNCGTCTNNTICTACINSTYLKAADCASSCGIGYYQDTISKTCNQCSANCSSCSSTGSITCINSTYLLSGVCVASCDIGYYQDTINMTCIPCSSNCNSCSNTECTQCINSTFLKSGVCVASCGIGYYPNSSTKTCNPCSANCEACSSSNTCTSCINNTFLLSGACVASCGIGYYQDTINKTCNQCSANCNICDNINNILVCSTCASSYYMKAGSCLLDCGPGYYNVISTMICHDCPTNCSLCTSGTVCSDCDSGFALKSSGGLALCDSCPDGQYASNSECFNCPDICTMCTSNSNCIGCISNASVSSLNGLCNCNLGFYYISGACSDAFTADATMKFDGTIDLIFSNVLDIELDASLLTFKDGFLVYDSSTFSLSILIERMKYAITLSKILLTGSNTMRLHFSSGSAILKSGALNLATQYIDILITSSSMTASCSSISNCATCSKPDTDFICDSCRESYCFYSDPNIRCGICCDAGYYQERVNSINICNKCANKCYTCNDSSSCSSCTGLNYLLIDDCVLECGLGRYKSPGKNKCLDCIYNCEECSDSIYCTICKAGYIYNSSSNECEPCPIGKYYSSGVCEECPTLCTACVSDTECIECIEHSYIYEGICECQRGYYEDIIDSSCMSCNIQDCASCEFDYESRSPVCLDCVDKKALTSEGCIQCPETSYYNYGDCIECPELCAECSKNIYCIRCKAFAEIISEECKCKSGFVKYLNECVRRIEISLTYVGNSKYKLSFSQPLTSELSYESITISINNHIYSSEEFTIQKQQGSLNEDYIITIKNLDLSQIDTISISFTNKDLIPGIDTSSSSYYSVHITSPYESNDVGYSQSSDIQEDYLAQDSSAKEIASMGSLLTTYTTIAATAMSFSSTTQLWSFINTIQLLSLISLLNVDLPMMLFAALISSRSYNPIPNIITYMIPEKGPRPFRRASLLGYETGQFLLNIGDIITALFITIGTLPILIIIKKVLPQRYQMKYIGKKVSQLIQDYRWNVFTRLYIEGYIEFAVAALIQLYTKSYLSDYSDYNMMINFIFAVLMIVIYI